MPGRDDLVIVDPMNAHTIPAVPIRARDSSTPPLVGRWGPDPIRFAWLAAAVGLAVADAANWLAAFRAGFDLPALGTDLLIYRDAASRWLHGDGFYSAYQLAAPYNVWDGAPILYPPTALPLFAAFTVLPAILWWAVPLGIVGAVVAYHRARPLALLVLLGLVLWPATLINAVYAGNPSMWCAAALAVATTGRSWAAPLMLIKPTLGPFALWGIRSRSWWIGLAAFALVSLLFLPMWRDYLSAIGNVRDGAWTYQLWHVPLMLVPVVARWGRRTAR